MTKRWTGTQILELARSYHHASILAAAAELELFDALEARARTATETARRLRCDPRGLAILLDALAAIGLLRKQRDRYAVPAELKGWLTRRAPHGVLPMVQHQANCQRRWIQLARVVRTGKPARREPSIRGARADEAAFIGAMHAISERNAPRVVRRIRPLAFDHLLDVGGGSGTWTMAFLRACPHATATLFDRPSVIPLARRRLREARFLPRVRLVSGDYLKDSLPRGADLAWVSAIVHQNSRRENRRLFAGVYRALAPGGRIAIRDIVMNRDRVTPVPGALFAVNMLVNTEGGGTFTFDELREDLRSVGFTNVHLAYRDIAMDSIMMASKVWRNGVSNRPVIL